MRTFVTTAVMCTLKITANTNISTVQFKTKDKMELKTAIEILEYHQEWRLGKREDMIHEPKKLTEALDVVINEVKKFRLGTVNNRALWRIEPYYDGISTVVTTYKVVDQNGTLQYMGDRNQCEYFLKNGC